MTTRRAVLKGAALPVAAAISVPTAVAATVKEKEAQSFLAHQFMEIPNYDTIRDYVLYLFDPENLDKTTSLKKLELLLEIEEEFRKVRVNDNFYISIDYRKVFYGDIEKPLYLEEFSIKFREKDQIHNSYIWCTLRNGKLYLREFPNKDDLPITWIKDSNWVRV